MSHMGKALSLGSVQGSAGPELGAKCAIVAAALKWQGAPGGAALLLQAPRGVPSTGASAR